MSKKIFVGSLPNGIQSDTLTETFSKYGQVEDIFIKTGCEAGRQWAFVTFADAAQAQLAKDSCDRQLTFPGQDRACDVMVAKNQGMFGQGNNAASAPAQGVCATETARKIFIGSLPDGIQEATLRDEFSKYGSIVDVFIKAGCEPGRQWAFVSFSTTEEAQLAKVSADRVLTFPGAAKACEVTLARNQGQFGQDPMDGSQRATSTAPGPKKVFVGSLPDNVAEEALRAEFEKFGTIVDVFIKTPCPSGRQWAFISYSTPEEANRAKEQADRVLIMPGAERACEVMLARNQGRNGAETLPGATVDYGRAQFAAAAAIIPGLYGVAQPGAAPMQPAWREYHTNAGLAYYHNHATGVTQWEKPPDFGVPTMVGMPCMAAMPVGMQAAPAIQAMPAFQPIAAIQTLPALQAAPAVQVAPAVQTMHVMQGVPGFQTIPTMQTGPTLAPAPVIAGMPDVRYAPY